MKLFRIKTPLKRTVAFDKSTKQMRKNVLSFILVIYLKYKI